MLYVAFSFVAFADYGFDNRVETSMFIPLVTCYCCLHICGTAVLTGQKRKTQLYSCSYFTRCYPILETLSLADCLGNLQQSLINDVTTLKAYCWTTS